MIPFTDFARLLTDVSECSDFDMYLAETGGSVPLDDADAVIAILRKIWEMGREGLTINSIARACNISKRQISIQLGIPTRTVENWSSTRTPSDWTLRLVAYAVLSLEE